MNSEDALCIVNLIDKADLVDEEKSRLVAEFLLIVAWWIASDHDFE